MQSYSVVAVNIKSTYVLVHHQLLLDRMTSTMIASQHCPLLGGGCQGRLCQGDGGGAKEVPGADARDPRRRAGVTLRCPSVRAATYSTALRRPTSTPTTTTTPRRSCLSSRTTRASPRRATARSGSTRSTRTTRRRARYIEDDDVFTVHREQIQHVLVENAPPLRHDLDYSEQEEHVIYASQAWQVDQGNDRWSAAAGSACWCTRAATASTSKASRRFWATTSWCSTRVTGRRRRAVAQRGRADPARRP